MTKSFTQHDDIEKKISDLGYTVTFFPLLTILPLSPDSDCAIHLQSTLLNLSRYTLAIFVSPSAVREVFSVLPGAKWPERVDIAVMGKSSERALYDEGVDPTLTRIICPDESSLSDSEALLALLDLAALKGRRVVIFRAASGRETLANALTKHGILVEKILAYQRVEPDLTPILLEQLIDLIYQATDWVVYSSEALKVLLNITKKIGDNVALQTLKHAKLWVIHPRILETAQASGFEHVHCVGLGDEKLLTALQSQKL